MKKIFILLTVISIPAVWFLVRPGGYEPHDLHHIADIHQMHRAFSSGQLPPRLGPDFLYGFSYPLFNYYYVLPFYLGAFFYGAFGSLMAALKGVFLVSVVISVYGMYLLLNKFFGKAASIAGAILYLYTPFRAVEIFVRGAIGEAFAIALFPWLLFGLITLVNKTSRRNIAFLAVTVALFLLTHNYFFLLVAPFTAALIFVLLYFEKARIEKLKALIFAGAIGVGLSAFWWLPAFAEYSLVSSVTPFSIIDHFPFIKQLIIPSWGYGSSEWGPNDLISFQIGIVNLIAIAVSIPIFWINRKKVNKSLAISALALLSFFVCIFMMNIRSLPLWNIIPFTNFIQFPWRLLSLTTFFTALLAGFVIDNLKHKKLFAILFAISCVVLTAGYFRPSKVFNNSDEHYLNRLFANVEFSEDYLLLPPYTSERPNFVPVQRFEVNNGQIVSINEVSPVRWEAEILANEDTTVEAYVLKFPGWHVEVDGQEVETRAKSPYGNIEFDIPEGIHNIKLYWAETNLRLMADLISVMSLLVIVVLLFRGKAMHATI